MQTSTLVILLTGIIAMLVALVCFLVWRMARKNDELRHKNKVIVQELERNQTLIERAVSHGVSRAALLLALPMLLALASCSDNDDNPAVPDEPEPQLADYTIIYYGHGGGNLDMGLLENIMQMYMADEESYKNVSICTQYKYSSLESMQELYDQYSALLGQYFEPGTPGYEEAQKELGIFKAFYPYAGKTARFVVDPGKAFIWGGDDGDAPTEPDMSAFIGPDNADITRTDSLTNFINWAAQACPARKYILVLSDHGGGYLPNDELPEGAAAQARTRGVVYDDGHKNSHFTAKTLAQAISQASVRPSVVYLDACLMNTAEYQFELAPTTDYLVLSTFVVPGEGGNYTELVDALSANPDNLEAALTRFAKATVEGWDKSASERADGEDDEPVYHDMSVYRTADLDALGAEIKTFTDRLVDAYQNGGDEVRAKIDKVTANAFRINEQQPEYDLIDYAVSLTLALPDVFGSALNSPLGEAFDRSIVYQQSSHWLMENAHAVDLSVLLGCQGHYTMLYDMGGQMPLPFSFYADGTTAVPFGDTTVPGKPWGSTLDETYGQLRFDRLTGWSRWLHLNSQEPNQECYTGYNPFADIILPDDLAPGE